ncbi:hypothetical protein SASPL_134588 [Salvia splendens]|uniref:Helicase ATP-binding domain-containing protein n=1 Tax=Salvia splendens TaxID=180675 RepID=A0A8X8WY04_SALSN|nr:hypothetical protein SASPL_134588 [Salvia splendens]
MRRIQQLELCHLRSLSLQTPIIIIYRTKLSEEDSCKEYKNFQMVKVHFLPSDDCSRPVLDIEDSVNVGLRVKGCSYFASRAMVEEAELIFCPYDYIINPAIREGHKINLPGSVIILDEAHNIDDVARECGSIDLEEEYLLELKTDLAQLSMIDDMTYRPLLEMTKGILGWIDRRKNTLGSDVKCRCWTGDEALKELEDASISLQNFGNLQDLSFVKAIKAATEVKSDMHRLRRKVWFFSTLCYFFSEIHSFDLALQRASKKVEDVWTSTYTFSLWCLNPAVVFKGIAELAQSVILTSGTLSPLNTFSSELGVKFDTSLQAQHVINVKSQVDSTSYVFHHVQSSSADKIEYQDAVGRSLAEIYKVVPGGCLYLQQPITGKKYQTTTGNNFVDFGQRSANGILVFNFVRATEVSIQWLGIRPSGDHGCPHLWKIVIKLLVSEKHT